MPRGRPKPSYEMAVLTFRTSADALIANFPAGRGSGLAVVLGVDQAFGFHLPEAQ